MSEIEHDALLTPAEPAGAAIAEPPSSPAREERSWLRRHRRGLLVALAVSLVVVLAAGAASWHFSSLVIVADHSPLSTNATVEALAASQVTLSRSEDTLRPGEYGIEWGGGHAVIGRVIDSNANTVTRQISAIRGRLTRGTRVAIGDVYVGDPRQALGVGFTSVAIPDELGAMPAWLIPGRRQGVWAIVVHGLNATREDGLYLAPALHRAGLPTLVISYREDPGAPGSPDGLLHMGLTEWHDLQAAARYALAHGARRLVLAGFSMGGAIVAQFMERSALAHDVAGLLLDAPALDWRAILEYNATEMGLPSFAANPVEWAIDLREAPNWNSLDALSHPGSFHLPILLFHGTADKTVPISTSNAFAKELPAWVTYYRVPAAGHVESWNVNPALYERRVEAFLSRIAGGVRN